MVKRRKDMTKELNSMTPRELKKFREATAIIAKAFDMSEEDIDVFFRFMKNAGGIAGQLDSHEKRIVSLERQILRETKADDAERAKRLYNALNTPVRKFADE